MRGGVAESFAKLGADDLAQNFGPDRMGAWPAVAAKHVWSAVRESSTLLVVIVATKDVWSAEGETAARRVIVVTAHDVAA